jgi:peptidoglycan hydrolase CwlO-like protein
MHKFKLAFLTFMLLFFSAFSVIVAQENCETISCTDADPGYLDCLNDKKTCLQKALDSTKAKKTTLENAISIINGNINIQQIKISQTRNEIAVLEKEISELDNRISGLSISLDRLSTLLVERIRTQYKREQVNPLSFIASSKSLAEFMTQFRYLRLAGQQTAGAMQKAENQRAVYDEQKFLKEIKQAEVEAKRQELQQEQNVLVDQRQEQQNLLSVTKNDEQKFQQLLKDAQAQIDSIRRYTTSRGGASLLSGTTSCDDWGCYYNQRDSEWGNQLIGRSNETMAQVGCLVTAVAMITSHYGKTLTPAQIAASSNPFFYNTADMLWTWSGSVNGVTATRSRVGYNVSALDSELNEGRPVIVRITASNSVGTHFVVITKKQDGKYMMKDPFEVDGNNIPFTDKHSLSQITAVDKVTVY